MRGWGSLHAIHDEAYATCQAAAGNIPTHEAHQAPSAASHPSHLNGTAGQQPGAQGLEGRCSLANGLQGPSNGSTLARWAQIGREAAFGAGSPQGSGGPFPLQAAGPFAQAPGFLPGHLGASPDTSIGRGMPWPMQGGSFITSGNPMPFLEPVSLLQGLGQASARTEGRLFSGGIASSEGDIAAPKLGQRPPTTTGQEAVASIPGGKPSLDDLAARFGFQLHMGGLVSWDGAGPCSSHGPATHAEALTHPLPWAQPQLPPRQETYIAQTPPPPSRRPSCHAPPGFDSLPRDQFGQTSAHPDQLAANSSPQNPPIPTGFWECGDHAISGNGITTARNSQHAIEAHNDGPPGFAAKVRYGFDGEGTHGAQQPGILRAPQQVPRVVEVRPPLCTFAATEFHQLNSLQVCKVPLCMLRSSGIWHHACFRGAWRTTLIHHCTYSDNVSVNALKCHAYEQVLCTHIYSPQERKLMNSS